MDLDIQLDALYQTKRLSPDCQTNELPLKGIRQDGNNTTVLVEIKATNVMACMCSMVVHVHVPCCVLLRHDMVRKVSHGISDCNEKPPNGQHASFCEQARLSETIIDPPILLTTHGLEHVGAARQTTSDE